MCAIFLYEVANFGPLPDRTVLSPMLKQFSENWDVPPEKQQLWQWPAGPYAYCSQLLYKVLLDEDQDQGLGFRF